MLYHLIKITEKNLNIITNQNLNNQIHYVKEKNNCFIEFQDSNKIRVSLGVNEKS